LGHEGHKSNLQESHRLIIGNLKPVTAARIGTGQIIIDPDQIITGLGELGSIEVTGSRGQCLFLGPPQPAHRELGSLAAPGTGIKGFFGVWGFVIKISFIHYDSPVKKRNQNFFNPILVRESEKALQRNMAWEGLLVKVLLTGKPVAHPSREFEEG
jgi:hypothetical protein